jgi:phosphate transport system substrate-binding protein
MPTQVYHFEILEKLPNGLYAARDEASKSMVHIYESTAEDALRTDGFDTLMEIATRLGCETFSASARRYIVGANDAQTQNLAQELQRAGFLGKLPPPPEKKQKKRGIAVPIIIVLLVLGIAAVAWYMMIPPRVVLRLEGSTTIGDELAARLMMGYLQHLGARNVARVPADRGEKLHHDVLATMPGQWRRVRFSILANGSGNSFTALHDHRADIAMASRPVNDKEVVMLKDIGNMRSPACETILGLDGIAIVVSSENPLDELSRQQVGAIFRGTVTDWSQVGKGSGPIHLYGRKSDSGTFDTFAAVVLDGNKSAFSQSVKPMESGDEITAAIAGDRDGIGYVGLGQVSPNKALQIFDGPNTASLLPSPFTVSIEDYILTRRLFLYTPAEPATLAHDFVTWATGPDGQEIVESVGFVKLAPNFETRPIPAGAPPSYREKVDGLRRMNVNFRFQTNSKTLDNKAIADIPRVEKALATNNIHDVFVLGFADNVGSWDANLKLSIERAQVVADKLTPYGIHVDVSGFSYDMPVADNATLLGKDKNRRVEIWVR